jgi:hypothetical protein
MSDEQRNVEGEWDEEFARIFSEIKHLHETVTRVAEDLCLVGKTHTGPQPWQPELPVVQCSTSSK